MELTHNSKPGQERKGKQGYLLFDYWDLEWSYLPDSQLGVPDEPRECIIVSEEGHVVYAPLASPDTPDDVIRDVVRHPMGASYVRAARQLAMRRPAVPDHRFLFEVMILAGMLKSGPNAMFDSNQRGIVASLLTHEVIRRASSEICTYAFRFAASFVPPDVWGAIQSKESQLTNKWGLPTLDINSYERNKLIYEFPEAEPTIA